MRYLLVDGQGNFGSVDGDPPAAYRYTEARLEKLAEEMMGDLDKETVDFVPNFDETTEEPTVLPTTYPNLLVNGSTGIAVGMATNIPPHNMREVIDGVLALIELKTKRTDTRTGRTARPATRASGRRSRRFRAPISRPADSIIGRQGIFNAYTTGRGSITVRAKATTEESKKGEKVADRRHGDPVPGQQEAAARKHCRPRARQGDRGDLRSARRIRPRRHADRHRAEARRAARAWCSTISTSTRSCRRRSASSCWRSSAAVRGCCRSWTSSSTSSSSAARWSGGGRSSSCAGPKLARTSSKACGSRSTTSIASSR